MTLFSQPLPCWTILIFWQGEITVSQPRLMLPEECIVKQYEISRLGRFLRYGTVV